MVCVYVLWLKYGLCVVVFMRDGKFVVIVMRWDCKDYINMLVCRGWEVMGIFGVDIVDLVDLEWLFIDSNIVVWDLFFEYKVFFCNIKLYFFVCIK